MKKLKPFSVKSMASLSREEMALINGGEFLSYYCYYEGQKCVVEADGGVNTGTCKHVNTDISTTVLTCVYD